jgi:peptidoglycan/LPS O-acetylase OafA/YrhL
MRILSERIIPFSNFGHSAVVVFFVLSGFVIAYVVDTKEHQARDYAASRMARIYSVALPALILTIIADAVGESLRPSIYADETTHDWGALRFVSSALFMNEFWGISITTFSNVPYWSLCYEVWYYIIFGIFVFWQGRGRLAVLLLALLLAGPKLLLLLPIWLSGVHLWRSRMGIRIGPAKGATLFFLSLVLLLLFLVFNIETALADFLKSQVGPDLYRKLTFSKWFLSDYLLAAIVYLNFAGFWGASVALGRYLVPAARPIRWLAGLTLSLYLFHKPLLLLFVALLHGDPRGMLFYFSTLACVLLTIAALAQVTEHQKDRYRMFFARLLGWLENRIRKQLPWLLPS